METRFNGNVVPFASNSTAGERTIFGDWNTESDDINDNLNDDFKLGWEAGLEGTLNPYPPSQYFNGSLFTITKLIAYLYQQGIAEWNATQEYKTNSITVGSNGNIYKSTIDNNIGNNPTTDIINWNIAFDSSLFVKLTDAQTIAGVKTFSDFPITPSSTPANDYQVANKKYVDDNNGLGYEQTWKDVTVDRREGVIYTNNTNRPIYVAVTVNANAANVRIRLSVDGVFVSSNTEVNSTANNFATAQAIVPHGSTYTVEADTTISGTIVVWAELS